ncbi:hypothetical protein B0J11DRAFT_276085 [Dendryphion nanum]|uniref:Uncharacterized protein n=1 Tax=Dendryphion nanum TaxID=256645 RepID=A0A9P9DY93_9PLEO|nr:hypothetical protein B0J11DRAFT_276085 [Dendryphion nanum]
MIFSTALLGGLLLAGHASATLSEGALLRRSDDLEDLLSKDASLLATLTRRQNSNGVENAPRISTTPASGDAAKADLAKWEADTKAACGSALQSLNGQASNPSGIAVCYNLPFLDNQTGIFQAELRMYNVSAPINPWVGVTAADVSMTLSYLGATVQNMNMTFQKRDITWPPIRSIEEDGLLVARQNTPNAPTELKVLSYVGKINSNLMGTAMTQATLQPLLIPQIELVARGPNGQEVKTTLSSQEASFVNGVFAKQASSTNDANSAASATALAAAAQPFFLPGTNLAFFPIGLVVTCVWTAGFILTVGLGTFGRIQFRDQYRRRIKREAANGMRTI